MVIFCPCCHAFGCEGRLQQCQVADAGDWGHHCLHLCDRKPETRTWSTEKQRTSWQGTRKHYWYLMCTQKGKCSYLKSLQVHWHMNTPTWGHLIAFKQTHGEMRKDKSVKSFYSFSHLHVGCSSGSPWFEMTASLTCMANLLYSSKLK